MRLKFYPFSEEDYVVSYQKFFSIQETGASREGQTNAAKAVKLLATIISLRKKTATVCRVMWNKYKYILFIML